MMISFKIFKTFKWRFYQNKDVPLIMLYLNITSNLCCKLFELNEDYPIIKKCLLDQGMAFLRSFCEFVSAIWITKMDCGRKPASTLPLLFSSTFCYLFQTFLINEWLKTCHKLETFHKVVSDTSRDWKAHVYDLFLCMFSFSVSLVSNDKKCKILWQCFIPFWPNAWVRLFQSWWMLTQD